ncbi:hypothetical protein BVX97_06385 [bacterium E08(2017)]|nr:hypothetical protein BVX97_06385 [bacterium E08(2017)]
MGGRDLRSLGYQNSEFELSVLDEPIRGDQLGNYAPGKAISSTHGEALSQTASVFVEVFGFLVDPEGTDYNHLLEDARGSLEMNFIGAEHGATQYVRE